MFSKLFKYTFIYADLFKQSHLKQVITWKDAFKVKKYIEGSIWILDLSNIVWIQYKSVWNFFRSVIKVIPIRLLFIW